MHLSQIRRKFFMIQLMFKILQRRDYIPAFHLILWQKIHDNQREYLQSFLHHIFQG